MAKKASTHLHFFWLNPTIPPNPPSPALLPKGGEKNHDITDVFKDQAFVAESFFLFVYMSSSITDGTPSVVSQIIHDGA